MSYICDFQESEHDLIECLHILREPVKYHPLSILLEEFKFCIQNILHHLIMNPLINLHELYNGSVKKFSSYNLIAEVLPTERCHHGRNHN